MGRDKFQRWIILIFLLMLTVGAAAWVMEGDTQTDKTSVEIVVPARQSAISPDKDTQSPEAVHLDKLRAQAPGSSSTDAFAALTWQKPAPKKIVPALPIVAEVPPPPRAPPPAVAPQLPALPFTYWGKLQSEEIGAVFLSNGERNFAIREGESIDSSYRLDMIAETRLTFTHLPSGAQQYLTIGDSP
jgi:hypothetical protein